jgi:hypothetical protein
LSHEERVPVVFGPWTKRETSIPDFEGRQETASAGENCLSARKSVYGAYYVSQTTRPGWIFDLTGAAPGFDFLRNHCLRCGMTLRLDLGSYACDRVVEAITDRTLIIGFFEINGYSQLALLDLNFSRVVDDRAIAVAAKPVFLGAQFISFHVGFSHRSHRDEIYRLAFLTAAAAEDRVFLHSFSD